MRIKKTSQYIDGGLSISDIYPVGSIYMSINNTNPSTLFGGTWEQIKDTFLLSAGDTYSAGTTGGEATHTLTVNEIPSHRHNVVTNDNVAIGYGGGVSGYGKLITNSTGYIATDIANQYRTSYTGGGQAHNNMPPYLTVYMWKRTA